MGQLKETPLITIEQYLALERASPERHEYLDGVIYAMAGEKLEHGDICVNLTISLGNQLKGKPCRVLTKDTKIRSGPAPKRNQSTAGLFSYPDLTVICGEPLYFDDKKEVITNPTVIIEVLSKTTESFDRGAKFNRYRKWNSTLTDYLLVSQTEKLVEHYQRQADASWSLNAYDKLKAAVPISSIKCTLKLADVYDRVVFPERSSE
jgi:Uma2 family endonuclease